MIRILRVIILTTMISIFAMNAGAEIKMAESFVEKEIEWSSVVAPIIAVLNKCGRPELPRRFAETQEEFFELCGATSKQRERIKKPLQEKWEVRNCSEVDRAERDMKELMQQRESTLKTVRTTINIYKPKECG